MRYIQIFEELFFNFLSIGYAIFLKIGHFANIIKNYYL
jgi:hypothetical protein